MVIAAVYCLHTRPELCHLQILYIRSQLSAPFSFLYFCLVFATQLWISIYNRPFFTSPLANTYIMCNDIDRVLCISATLYWYIMNFGFHRPDTACSPSPEDNNIPAGVVSTQESKVTFMINRFLVEIYTVLKATSHVIQE